MGLFNSKSKEEKKREAYDRGRKRGANNNGPQHVIDGVIDAFSLPAETEEEAEVRQAEREGYKHGRKERFG